MSIIVQLPSRMDCNEKDCKESVPVRLCLLGSGGFGFQPARATEGEWQILAPMGGAGAFETRCPTHHREVKKPPIIQPVAGRLVDANGK